MLALRQVWLLLCWCGVGHLCPASPTCHRGAGVPMLPMGTNLVSTDYPVPSPSLPVALLLEVNTAVDRTQSGISLVCPQDLLFPKALGWNWAEPTKGSRGSNQHPRLAVWPKPRAGQVVGWRGSHRRELGKDRPMLAVRPGWLKSKPRKLRHPLNPKHTRLDHTPGLWAARNPRKCFLPLVFV